MRYINFIFACLLLGSSVLCVEAKDVIHNPKTSSDRQECYKYFYATAKQLNDSLSKYWFVEPVKNGMIAVSPVDSTDFDYFGYMNQKGKLIIPCICSVGTCGDDGFNKYGYNITRLSLPDSYSIGCFDTLGHTIVPFKYDNIEYDNHKGIFTAITFNQDDTYSADYYNCKGIFLRHDSVYYDNNLHQKFCNDSMYGFTNSRGDFVIPCKFTDVRHVEFVYDKSGTLLIAHNGKVTVIDTFGNILSDHVYDSVMNGECSDEDLECYVVTNIQTDETCSYGLINRRGKQLLPCEYDGLTYPNRGLTNALKNNMSMVVDTFNHMLYRAPKNMEIEKLSFSETGDTVFVNLKSVHGKKQCVVWLNRKTGKYGIVPNVDFLYDFQCGYASARRGEKEGYIDTDFNVAVPFVFIYTWTISEGYGLVRTDELEGKANFFIDFSKLKH